MTANSWAAKKGWQDTKLLAKSSAQKVTEQSFLDSYVANKKPLSNSVSKCKIYINFLVTCSINDNAEISFHVLPPDFCTIIIKFTNECENLYLLIYSNFPVYIFFASTGHIWPEWLDSRNWILSQGNCRCIAKHNLFVLW